MVFNLAFGLGLTPTKSIAANLIIIILLRIILLYKDNNNNNNKKIIINTPKSRGNHRSMGHRPPNRKQSIKWFPLLPTHSLAYPRNYSSQNWKQPISFSQCKKRLYFFLENI